MKLVTFAVNGKSRPGVLVNDRVIDLAAAGLPVGTDGDLLEIIRGVKSVGFWLLGWRADAKAQVQAKETHQLVICPVHAAIFKKAGWNKQRVREYMFAHARLPFSELMANTEPAAFRGAHPKLQWLWDSPETRIPVLETADCFDIIVAGGMGGRSAYSYGAAEPVSRSIDDWM